MIVAGDNADLVRSRAALLGPGALWNVDAPAAPIVPAMIEAVYSIANRRTVAANVLARYRGARLAVGEDADRDTPAHLAVAIRACGGPAAFAEVVDNRQRTGARGILRTEALLQLADALATAGVAGSAQLRQASAPALLELRAAWTTVSGQRSGISWDRFLLVTDVPQPFSGAMVRRFVARALGRADTGVTGSEAADLLEVVARDLGSTRRRLELAMWRYEMEGGDGLAEAKRRKPGPGTGRVGVGENATAPPAPPDLVGARSSSTPPPAMVDRAGARVSPAAVVAPAASAPIDRGTPGASARRVDQRRRDRRAPRAGHGNPLINALLLALENEPQSSWAKGAEGEELVGRSLEKRCGAGVEVLHDRRVPGTRANIDHLTIGRAGVWVIDTKHYAGKAAVTTTPTGRTRLTIDGNDCSKLIEKLAAQVGLVTAAVAEIDRGVPVHGALGMVGTDLPVLRTLSFGGFPLLHPRALARQVSAAGPLADRRVQAVTSGLAAHFVPA